jgi:hypothetical protein
MNRLAHHEEVILRKKRKPHCRHRESNFRMSDTAVSETYVLPLTPHVCV